MLVMLSWTISVFVGITWFNAYKNISIRVRQGNVSIFVHYVDKMPEEALERYNSQKCGWSFEKLETTIFFRDWLPGHTCAKWWRLIVVPLWTPALISAGVAVGLSWRYHRFPAGHCQNCGYDLVHWAAKKCPECGLTVGSTVVASY
jgi:hypothetical protein